MNEKIEKVEYYYYRIKCGNLELIYDPKNDDRLRLSSSLGGCTQEDIKDIYDELIKLKEDLKDKK